MSSRVSGAREAPFVDEGASEIPESLVLDIGDDVGALVLYADEELLGSEIAVSSVDAHAYHTHTIIRRRRAVDREFVAGVYPELPAGTYTVWGTDGEQIASVVIDGGRVTECHAGIRRA